MKLSICHYSYHRTWEAKNWNCHDLVKAVEDLGADGIDFHVKYLGDPETAADRVTEALSGSSLELSGISMSNNFNQPEEKAYREQIDTVKTWLKVAAQLKSPASRIFGGHIATEDRNDPELCKAALALITQALAEVTAEAEKLGIVLALENHGGAPCSGQEQVDIIKAINSPNLRATIDVGNYMQCGQEGHEGTAIAAPYCTYVHFKDFIKTEPETPSMKWGMKSSVVGKGDVDHRACLEIMRDTGFTGFVAIEYEGSDDELTGVPESFEFTANLMREMGLRG
jgi:sugar phosphate isomerase/epimerase